MVLVRRANESHRSCEVRKVNLGDDKVETSVLAGMQATRRTCTLTVDGAVWFWKLVSFWRRLGRVEQEGGKKDCIWTILRTDWSAVITGETSWRLLL